MRNACRDIGISLIRARGGTHFERRRGGDCGCPSTHVIGESRLDVEY